MTVQKNISLKPYNTFGIDAKASHFCEVNTIHDLREALQLKEYPNRFILGGGSNMLITKDMDALVLHINLKGIHVVLEEEGHVVVRVMAGENWHRMVLWTLDRNYGGLENLSLIPGNAGTAPIQNIGAYGVELKDVFESCEAMEVNNGNIKSFDREQCRFGYRDSFFKNEGKDRYIIVSVDLRLTRKDHKLNTSYGAIADELKKSNITDPGIKDVSNVVMAIRKGKLPDPKILGNSGSFFKNPVVNATEFEKLRLNYPETPFYKVNDDEYKIPAGWLIEQCGFKGKRFGDAGVHANQALVLVNYGDATGKEILDLAHLVMEEVYQKFGVRISPEVNIIK